MKKTMIPIITTIFIRQNETNPEIPAGIHHCIRTLAHHRFLAIDEAPVEFQRNLVDEGHTLYIPPDGEPPRMLWNIARALQTITPLPEWFATIEQDVAVSIQSFAAASAIAEAAPIAVGALALATQQFPHKDLPIFAPIPMPSPPGPPWDQLWKTRTLTFEATLWRTASFTQSDLFHAPPMDGADIVISARLRSAGYSLFHLLNIPARHYHYLSTRHFRQNRFHMKRKAPSTFQEPICF